MLCYFDHDQEAIAQQMGRYHPWTVTLGTEGGAYLDLKSEPDLVLTKIEDLHPHSDTVFAAEAERFLRWANAGQAVFETNDFGSKAVEPNHSPNASDKQLQIIARVSVLFQDLALNCTPHIIGRFSGRVLTELESVDHDFPDACWSLSRWPHRFTALEGAERDEGVTFLFHLWAWGDTKEETERNGARAFINLRKALEAASAVVTQSTSPALT